MKVITLLSIFVLFFLINITVAVSSKENFEDAPEAAATQVVDTVKKTPTVFSSLLGALGTELAKPVTATQEGIISGKPAAETDEFASEDNMTVEPAEDIFGDEDSD
jgi:hypothetical protein